MRFTTEGVPLDYTTAGPRTGMPVVLIHGFPFSKEMWAPQLAPLSAEHYVVTYDVRGHGASGRGDGQYSIEMFVDDLIALIDHLKLSRVVVCGLSMGGYIALRAIERHPERFRGLILCDTKSEADNNEARIRRAEQMKAVKTGGMRTFAENYLKSVFYKKTFAANPEAVELIRRTIEAADPFAVAGTFLALAARTDTTAALYSIAVPSLILVGHHDVLTPPSAARAMQEKIPRSVLHVIPHAAHLSTLENPEEATEHMLEYLKGLTA
jgi:3-oxoadipate enol-lactonase